MEPSKKTWFDEVEGLPSLPGQMLTVLQEVDRLSGMNTEILDIIKFDPAIACRVLRAANLPLYGRPGQICTLNQASVVLGPGPIKNIILMTPVLERFGKNVLGENCVEFPRLWRHVSVTAGLSGCLARTLEPLEPDVCFTAGLIHDIGKLALIVERPGDFLKVLHRAREGGLLLQEAEREVLGVTHGEIGARLAAHWGFPELFIEMFNASVPQPGEVPGDPLAAVVRLAKYLAFEWQCGDGMELRNPVDPDLLLPVLGMSRDDLKSWVPELQSVAEMVVKNLEV